MFRVRIIRKDRSADLTTLLGVDAHTSGATSAAPEGSACREAPPGHDKAEHFETICDFFKLMLSPVEGKPSPGPPPKSAAR